MTAAGFAFAYANANPVNVTLTVSRLCGPTDTITKTIIPDQVITTLFAGGNNGGPGWSHLFDISVTNPKGIEIHDLDICSNSAASTPFTLDIYLTSDSYVGKEMTAELQVLKQSAVLQPGVPVALVTKGVDFGTVTWSQGVFDLSQVVGVADDLVVRPFGRKGEFQSTRAFDIEAMQFHFGMQPVEVVGTTDADGDGVTQEVLVGELSALSIFATTLERPRQEPSKLAS